MGYQKKSNEADIGNDKGEYRIDATTKKVPSFDGSIIFDNSERSTSGKRIAFIDSDEGSEQFDGEYLQRLKSRSMPEEVKRMLSGRCLTKIKNNKISEELT